MFYATKQNKYIQEGTAFELDGVQYPAVWLNQATAEQKAALGLEEVIATNAPADSRYYWVSETLNGAELTYTNTPKDLDELKKNSVSQLNATAYSLLLPSDWMVIRAAEGTPIAADWTAYRSAVRTAANTARDQIDMAFDIDSLIAASNVDWPKDPNYVPPVEEPVTPVEPDTIPQA